MINRYKLSVISSVSRGPEYLEQLIRDMRNQTLSKDLWEHVIVFDGLPKDGCLEVIEAHKYDYHMTAYNIFKNPDDGVPGRGVSPKNHGTATCRGAYVCYCDDDDRFRDTYLRDLLSGTHDNVISCVQMSATDYRICGGSKKHSILIPEIDCKTIPYQCHFGCPCMIYKKEWAMRYPFLNCSDNDYHFARIILDIFQPTINFIAGWNVDPDGTNVGLLKDWVTQPPYYRGK